MINNSSTVSFHELFIDKYNDLDEEYIVGRKDVGEYINVPSVAIEAIELLKKGYRIIDAEDKLSQKYNEEIGVLDFIDTCKEVGFLKEIDNKVIEEESTNKVEDQLSFITPKIAKFFFNKYSWMAYFAMFIYSLGIYLMVPSTVPRIRDFLFHDSMTVVVVVGLISMWGLIYIHELGHLIASRAHNTESKVKFGRSGMYLVIETIIPNIWTTDKKARNEIFLAGLAFNSIMLSLTLTLVALSESGVISIGAGLTDYLRFICIINVWSFITQPLIFTKSDLYYLLNNQLNCSDLHGNTALYIKQKFLKKNGEHNYLNQLSEQEQRFIKRYSIVYVVGQIFSFVVAVLYTLFTIWVFMYYSEILSSFAITKLKFWDSVFGVGYLLTPIIWLFIYLLIDFFRSRHIKNVAR